MLFSRLLSNRARSSCAPRGWRAYAVGDVHGRLDLLDQLLAAIRSDHQRRPKAKALLIFLGDLIDRGPDSAGVIERLVTLGCSDFRVITLAGNHEEVLLDVLSGNDHQFAGWLRFGGAEALRSYGLDPDAVATLPPAEAARQIAGTMPVTHRRLLSELGDSFRFGDYLFVHAGIRPGIPLEQQSTTDLRWIREPFLSDTRDHGMTVVHGHTISERVEEAGSRIGIDTGAYQSGRLTALGLEGQQRWTIDTVDGLIERTKTDA